MAVSSDKTLSALSSYGGFGIIPSSAGKDGGSTSLLGCLWSSMLLPWLEGPRHLPAGDNPAAFERIQLPSEALNQAREEALELLPGHRHPCATTVTLLQRPPGGLRAEDGPGMVPITGLLCLWGFACVSTLCPGQGTTFAPPPSARGCEPGLQPPLPLAAWQRLRADFCSHLPLGASKRDVTEP